MKKEIKNRVVWGFNPITRVKPSKKLYSRKKFKNKLYIDRYKNKY